MQSNQEIKKILENINEPVWREEVMVCALLAKQERRMKKNSKAKNQFVLLKEGKNLNEIYDELEIFLSLLNATIMMNSQISLRFQAAIYRHKTHWYALDIFI